MNSEANNVSCADEYLSSAHRTKEIIRSRGTLEAEVEAIRARVRQYPCHPLTLVDMERLSGFSRRSLENEFHRQFGCSPIKWQRTERLNIAHEYLMHTRGAIAIGELAQQFGFDSTSKFIAYYKRYFGETPRKTALRAQNTKGERRFRPASTPEVRIAE
jgi:transcriptional regulator GlxA family with amidase domain